MADEQMEAPQQVPEREKDGVPGSEVLGLSGNAVAIALMALGGLWVWLAVALAGGVAGLAGWRYSKRRKARGHGRTSAASGPHGRGGTARSGGWSPFARTGSGRRGTGRAPAGRIGARTRGRAAEGGPSGRGKRGRRTGTGTSGAKPRRGLFAGRGKGRRSGASGKGPSKSAASGRSPRRSLGALLGRGGKAGTSGHGPRSTKRPGTSRRRSARGPDPRRGDTVLLPGKKRPAPNPATAKPRTGKPPATTPAKPAEKRPTPQAPARPRTSIPHPNRSTNTNTTDPKGTIMGLFGRMWRQHSEEQLSAATRYDPENMPSYYGDLQDLVVAFQNQAAALGKMSAISQADLPVTKNVAEYIAQLQSLMFTIAEGANSTVSAFLKQHEADMARHNQPRPNEKKWNV